MIKAKAGLGLYEVLGRTGPPILGGRLFQTALLTNLFSTTIKVKIQMPFY